MTRPRALLLAALLGVSAAPGVASASAPADVTNTPRTSEIFGGYAVGECEWPTTVSLGGCTGTLIHPRLVVYAKHCGVDVPEIVLGENVGGGVARVLETTRCEGHPDPLVFGEGKDIAFCLLKETVDDVPIVPVLTGCEADALTPGTKTTLVGFGVDENNNSGVKRAVTTTIEDLPGGEILLGGDGKDACYGDSGGPAYLRLNPDAFPGEDPGWRVFGITSYGKSCGGSTYYSMIHTNLEWLEGASGVDVTPCHDADGTWNPSARCRQFPSDPAGAGLAWADGCAGGPTTEWIETCGAAYPQPLDETGPVVTVTAPGDGSVFETDKPNLRIYVRVDSDDGDGWGLTHHTFYIDGEPLPYSTTSATPMELQDLVFPVGTFVLTAQATDLAGNVSESPPVTITVGPAGEPATTGDGSSSGTGTETGEGTTGAGGEDTTGAGPETTDGADKGCGCSARPGQRGAALLGLGLFALAVGRRRRPRLPR